MRIAVPNPQLSGTGLGVAADGEHQCHAQEMGLLSADSVTISFRAIAPEPRFPRNLSGVHLHSATTGGPFDTLIAGALVH